MRLLRVALMSLAMVAMVPHAPARPPDLGLVHHDSTGGVQIRALPGASNDGAFHYMKNPSVTVTIPPPSGAASHVRLSNDGSTWVVRPYAASVSWSLTDPAAGGIPDDGPKAVHVEYGDGTTWTRAGGDTAYLDRVAPEWPGYELEGGAASAAKWVVLPGDNPVDAVSGIGQWRMSFDGVRWSDWGPIPFPDLRSIELGGSWALGQRTVYLQGRDQANNFTPVYSDTINITMPPLNPDQGNLPMRFEFPRKAVTGELFTIKPIYPTGFRFAAGAVCTWHLHWGDEESLYGPPNENFGELLFERAATAGGCGEWTFTLPWVPVPRFDFYFTVTSGNQVYETANWKINYFTARVGGTSRHITSSTIPLVYVLPDTTMSDLGDSVTYRLHASGGLPIPQTGQFWAYPRDCYLNPHFSQNGGTTFTYKPICAGNWVTGWTGTYKGGYMRSQYDPVVDGRAPTVTVPTARLRSASVVVDAPVDVLWSAKDADSGVYASELQRSLNGGTWRAVSLRTRSATSASTGMPLTGTTRFRVRARDRVGNWSAWVYGPVLRGAMYQDTSPYLKWGGAWTPASSSDWYAGSARTTTAAGATSRFTFNGRSIGWVARTGPAEGLARVYIDGVLAATVDLRAPAWGYRAVRYVRTWATPGWHTIEVRNLGTAGTPGTNVDGFIVLH